ncbi:MAG: hypothetical protein COV45_01205 [Deltaproteobacteria bacterium CG11_big_fil_rev_8_21_14_0_20_47_16]|nr:MAG: hypothetical protein COV45_01205 [Deltaproteobacteria bacterium CG11_big_fil_rev_8_21_14_0_20_47_16]
MKLYSTSDPYQWFFPIGILFGVVGTGLWVAYKFHFIVGYPGGLHADLMSGGFFLSIALGFLMTAAPKFSGTESATFLEKLTQASVLGLMLLVVFRGDSTGFHVLLIVELLFLILFLMRRFSRATQRVLPALLFAAFGLGSALLGSAILAVADVWTVPDGALRFGKLLLFYATSLYLILGVGAQLLPMLMGTTHLARIRLQQTKIQILWSATIVMAGFLLEAYGNVVVGRFIRTGIITWIMFGRWKVCYRPRSGTVLGYMVWLSTWMVLIGMWVMVVLPQYPLVGGHLYFIGGVSLMVFSVATRVVLAHGGHGLMVERRSKILWLLLLLLGAAVLTRSAAPFLKGMYESHLAYAAICWILASVTWLVAFLPKLYLRKN